MRISVVYYGRLKESTGTKTEQFEIDETHLTVKSLIARITDCYPALQEQLDTVAFTIGAELVSPETPVKDGDEIGFLPPVSGG